MSAVVMEVEITPKSSLRLRHHLILARDVLLRHCSHTPNLVQAEGIWSHLTDEVCAYAVQSARGVSPWFRPVLAISTDLQCMFPISEQQLK